MRSSILFLTLCLHFFLFSEAPLVVNGVRTKSFNPVVKLTTGTQYEAYRPEGTCTGTFIKKGYILTAAHCVTKLYLEVVNYKLNYLLSEKGMPLLVKPAIRINAEVASRVEKIFIHPVYLSYTNLENNFLESVLELKKKVEQKEIGIEQARAFVQLQKEAIKMKSLAKIQAVDLAILKVTPKDKDRIFELADFQLSEGDKVFMVGFGHALSGHKVDALKREAAGYWNLYQAGIEPQKNHRKYQEAISKLKESGKGLKRYGTNRVSFVREGKYQIIGESEVAKTSWNKWTSYFYEWKKADGKNASISYGDSGGPLLVRGGAHFYVAGVTSTTWHNRVNKKNTSTYADLSSESSQRFIESILEN